MVTVDDVLALPQEGDGQALFEEMAMEIFRRQARFCAPYKEYLSKIGVDPWGVSAVSEIPFLPIQVFKNQRVYCSDCGEPEVVFCSSGTGGQAGPSKHYVSSVENYRKIYTRGFEIFYGGSGVSGGAGVSRASRASQWPKIFALLPGYLEREGSSLIEMARGLGSIFYLNNHDRLLLDLEAEKGPKILLGVSYALLDLAEKIDTAMFKNLTSGLIIMETGGMKGRREEMSKSQLHSILQHAFGVTTIHSEYGMAELMSQAYSFGKGVFLTPPWMKIMIRDPRDPFDVKDKNEANLLHKNTNAMFKNLTFHSAQPPQKNTEVKGIKGGINIIDLGNFDSCAFIQTQDLGTLFSDGSFTVDGRIAKSDIRGCNLLIQ